MVSKISYFILFEIIIFAKGNPGNRQGSDHQELQYGLKKLVEDIMKQGNYDVMLNHHEDLPGRHHEDITHITYNGGKPKSRYNKEKYRSAEYPYQGVNGKNTQYNNRPSYTNTQNYNLFLRKRPNVENNIHLEESKYKPQTRSESDKVDDVLEFLNDLDKTLKIKGTKDLELRCSGNRCGGSRYESANSDREVFYIPDKYYNGNLLNDNYNRQLRCNGRSCSRDRDDDRNDVDSLRCYGNSCSRKANDRDDYVDDDDRYNDDNSDFSNILRCAGDNCGLNRDDDDDDDNDDRVGVDSLRCVGDTCGLNRDNDDDYNDDDRVGIDSLRCAGDRCGLNRNDDDDDRDRIDSLRCVGDRCGLNRNDDDRDGVDSLRCVGDTCSFNRNDVDALRCVGDTCSFNRNDIDSLRCVGDTCSFNRNDVDSLRCVGDTCSFNRNDDDDDDTDDTNSFRCFGDRCGRNRDDDERDNLRCIGNRCGRSRNDDDDQDANRNYEDVEDAAEIVDAYLLRAFDSSLRGKVSPAEKRRFLNEVKKLFSTLNKKLHDAVNGNGRYPPNQVNL